jgi:hypothetical protein
MPEVFNINYNDQTVKIEVHDINGQTIYRAHMIGKHPIVLSRARNAMGNYFWTLIPQGDKKIANEIGALIEEHVKK